MKDRSVIPIAVLLFVILNACNSGSYTMEDFNSIQKIDSHIHLNAESTALSEQAKVDNFLLLNVNVDVPHHLPMEEQHRIALLQSERNPGQIRFMSAFTLQKWDSANWTKETIAKLKTAFGQGALGIKLWKNIGMVYRDSADQFIMIDHPRFDSVINYIIGEDKTVLGHLGEPKNCWLPLDQMTVNNDRNYFKDNPEYHMFLHPDYPSYEDQIDARDAFLERHPDMRFVGAHLGSLEWDVDELAKRFDRFPNMAVDMAARIPHLQHQTISDRDKIRKFFIKYQDRLIYGTDSGINKDSDPGEEKKSLHDTWLRDWKYFVTDETLTADAVNGEFQGLKLPREVIDKIFNTNAIHWFKIKSESREDPK